MNRQFPQPDTPESREGTAAHWVFAEMLAGRPVVEGAIAPNGVFVTAEMLEGAELICDVVASRGMKLPHVEESIRCKDIHAECWGTPDIWEFVESPIRDDYTRSGGRYGVIELIDYKFGHRFVDEYENDQCVAYIAGIQELFSHFRCMIDQDIQINITIVQPRCFYKGSAVRTWSVLASDLREQINILTAAAARAMAPNPQAVTNSECCYCPGRHACPALQQAAYNDAEFAVTSAPVELSPQAASLELKMLERALERLQARTEGMREVVTGYARQGLPVPWHRLEQGTARKQWTRPPGEIVAMGTLMGHDLSKPGIVTPTQAAKLGIDDAVITFYSITPPGSFKLVSDNPADIRRVFGK